MDGFFEAAATLDERSAPQEGRCAVLSPRQYYSLISSVDTNILNREIGNSQGDMNSGKGLYSIAGIRIYKTNNLPTQNRQSLPQVRTTATPETSPTWLASSSTVKPLGSSPSLLRRPPVETSMSSTKAT